MKKIVKILILTAAILFGASDALSQTTQYRLGISHASSLYSNKEQFEFSIGGESVVLNTANPVIYFNKKFSAGQSYQITQTSGPRTCDLQGATRGVFGNQDIVVTAKCGYPPLSIFKMEVSGIEQGEIFKFADNYRRAYQYPFSTTANLGGYPQGDDYNVTQTGGPRPCRMSLNQGVVPAAPVIVKADCGRNPVPTNTPPPTLPGSFKDFELVSRSADDKKFGTFYDSSAVVIGGTGADEGRYVAFVSYAAGLANSSGKYRQIIWRDRKTGETRIASVGIGGAEGNQNSFAPAMSADGKKVAFESYATNLVPVDTNKVRDVFVWDYDANTVTAVSENRGTETDAEAFEPAISADGNLIAFSSSASNLTSGVDGTSTVNVFLRDMRSGAVTLISKKEKDGKGGGGSRPSISDDGSRIAFYSYFPLTDEDKNNLWDIYVWQSGAGKLKRVTKTASGGEKDQGDESASRVVMPTISGDGRFVAFSTTATNMISGDTAKLQDAFLAEIGSGRIAHLSAAGGGFGDGDSPFGQGERIALTSDGRQAVFTTKAKNLGGSLVLVSTIEGSNLRAVLPLMIDGVTVSLSSPAISQTGKCIAFGSNAKLDKRFASSGIFVTCK
jgi:TolB protein